MKWLARKGGLQQKVGGLNYSSSGAFRNLGPYKEGWDIDRAVTEGMGRVTWVYRCIDAIAGNAARVPSVFRRGDTVNGPEIDGHPLLEVLNTKSNKGEDSFVFRYRLSAQLLISRKGAFVEVIRNRGTGDPIGLMLLPPQFVKPNPHPTKFVSSFDLHLPGQDPKTLRPENIIWFRKPHPTDPYAAFPPLEAAGLAVESEYLAKSYNRNFLVNDGRPGGLVIVKGEMTEDDKEELRSRFRGSVANAGRISVIASEDGADFVDTAVTPRDAQYSEGRKANKEEILMAFGVPESVLANAAGRTFDNAEQERLIFWMETMLPHLELVARPFDILDPTPNTFFGFDLSGVDVLQRMEMKRREFLLREFDAGLRTQNEYRIEVASSPIPGGRGDILYLPKTRIPVVNAKTGEEIDLPDGSATPGRPSPERQEEEPEEPRTEDEEEAAAERERPQLARAASAQSYLGSGYSTSSNNAEVTLRIVTGADETKALPTSTSQTTTVEVGKFKVDASHWERFTEQTLNGYDRWEVIYERTLQRFFERQHRVVTEKMLGKKTRSWFAKREAFVSAVESENALVDQSFDFKDAIEGFFDEGVWNDQLDEDMRPLVRDTAREFADPVARSLDITLEDVFLLPVIDRVIDQIKSINHTTKNEIMDALQRVEAAGGDESMRVDAVKGVFRKASDSRAKQIAMTEVLASANGAKFAVASIYEGTIEKTWVSMEDDRVRESHDEVHGETLLLSEPFPVGLSLMQYPGDPAGGVEEIINCRCGLFLSVDSGPLL